MELLRTIRPLLLGGLLLWANAARAQTEQAPSATLEYQVKAAFLYNFLKFVEWPTEAPGQIPGPDQRFVIGVVSSPAFADVLEATVHGKSVNGRRVIVARLAKLAEARGCQEVFIPAPAPRTISAPPGVLTVGEEPRFLDAGGILTFSWNDNKVGFKIDAENAKTSGLHVSAQLLKLGSAR